MSSRAGSGGNRTLGAVHKSTFTGSALPAARRFRIQLDAFGFDDPVSRFLVSRLEFDCKHLAMGAFHALRRQR